MQEQCKDIVQCNTSDLGYGSAPANMSAIKLTNWGTNSSKFSFSTKTRSILVLIIIYDETIKSLNSISAKMSEYGHSFQKFILKF